jgi:hypothetical protein
MREIRTSGSMRGRRNRTSAQRACALLYRSLWLVSLPQMVKEIATYPRGWLGYFGDCQTPSVLRSLETWLRRRFRSVVWKQWKRGRTRYRKLRERGVGKDLAAQTAGSPNGPCGSRTRPLLGITQEQVHSCGLIV